ncbi:MAG: Tn3 family transposase [Verrucomicrobia bacterium]|nr:Tn3 family transposase [Verrucomicrobiota bacterium]
MRIDKNFVDSHGQSEVAFAFCHLLGGVRLMPRLKRIKYERLYLPEKGIAADYPNLAGTFARPIRWELIEQQYDEMVKATVAVKRGTATSEAILKRYNSYNVTHPTYKAFAEVGKAEKTIFSAITLSRERFNGRSTRDSMSLRTGTRPMTSSAMVVRANWPRIAENSRKW